MNIRQGKEFYAQNYDKVLNLAKQGKSAAQIAKELNISYSCVYSWIKQLRKPQQGALVEMHEFLRKNGPLPVSQIEQQFPSHDDFFQQSQNRNISIKRYKTSSSRLLAKNSVWYYLAGQEELLKQRILKMLKQYKELNKLI